MTNWLCRPVQRTRLNLSLSHAAWARLCITAAFFGGEVFGFGGAMMLRYDMRTELKETREERRVTDKMEGRIMKNTLASPERSVIYCL